MANLEVMRQLRRVAVDAPEELLHMRAVVDHTACGTARCLLGWAIIDPWFQANTMISEIFSPDYDHTHILTDGIRTSIDNQLYDIFGLTNIQFRYLFGGELSIRSAPHAVSKDEVLQNIDRILEGQNPQQYAAVLK